MCTYFKIGVQQEVHHVMCTNSYTSHGVNHGLWYWSWTYLIGGRNFNVVHNWFHSLWLLPWSVKPIVVLHLVICLVIIFPTFIVQNITAPYPHFYTGSQPTNICTSPPLLINSTKSLNNKTNFGKNNFNLLLSYLHPRIIKKIANST